jgi:hypothetical protein
MKDRELLSKPVKEVRDELARLRVFESATKRFVGELLKNHASELTDYQWRLDATDSKARAFQLKYDDECAAHAETTADYNRVFAELDAERASHTRTHEFLENEVNAHAETKAEVERLAEKLIRFRTENDRDRKLCLKVMEGANAACDESERKRKIAVEALQAAPHWDTDHDEWCQRRNLHPYPGKNSCVCHVWKIRNAIDAQEDKSWPDSK